MAWRPSTAAQNIAVERLTCAEQVDIRGIYFSSRGRNEFSTWREIRTPVSYMFGCPAERPRKPWLPQWLPCDWLPTYPALTRRFRGNSLETASVETIASCENQSANLGGANLRRLLPAGALQKPESGVRIVGTGRTDSGQKKAPHGPGAGLKSWLNFCLKRVRGKVTLPGMPLNGM
jgi:hypothetical protein